ncbi:MAG: glycine--tRNA ligase subunit beta [Actinomycetota bacterium]|nr:glycine--tRNA ligase subunit beta [Actinomycetota bacterium]
MKRTAGLCKCDLVTNMVVEFPQLQGIVGREYALEKGEKPSVAKGIFEHYRPRFAGDQPAPDRRGGPAVCCREDGYHLRYVFAG